MAGSPLFHDINREKIAMMLVCIKPKIQGYKKHAIIAVSGKPFRGSGIIVRGKVAFNQRKGVRRPHYFDILNEGDVIGEMIDFSNGKRWPVTVIAQENSYLLFLPHILYSTIAMTSVNAAPC